MVRIKNYPWASTANWDVGLEILNGPQKASCHPYAVQQNEQYSFEGKYGLLHSPAIPKIVSAKTRGYATSIAKNLSQPSRSHCCQQLYGLVSLAIHSMYSL